VDLRLDERQERLVAAFREFGEKYFTDEQIKQWCRGQGLPDEVATGFVNQYFSLKDLMDNKSNNGFSLLSQALIIEELSRCAGATLPFQNDLFNLQIIEEFAANGEFQPILDNYRQTGRLLFGLAISEPDAGSDTMSMQTSTSTKEGKIILQGVKTYVNNGEYAPYLLVAAIDKDETEKTNHPPLAFWLLPRDLPGITAFPIAKVGQSMLPFASLVFDKVEVVPEYRLTGRQGGFKQLFRLLQIGRVFSCASSLGMAQAAMEDAVAHAFHRKAFGEKIGGFQQIEQMLTDMEVTLSNMRMMLYRTAWEVDNAAPSERLSVALAKRYIPQAATEVASQAMQIFGGVGYTEHCRVARIWQDCRGNQIAEGTDQIMVYIAGPLIMQKYMAEEQEKWFPRLIG